jgi:hypothetical protein
MDRSYHVEFSSRTGIATKTSDISAVLAFSRVGVLEVMIRKRNS